MGFEPTVPLGHTAFREPHLKPLGQLSVMCFTDSIILAQNNRIGKGKIYVVSKLQIGYNVIDIDFV